jgi:hypothetical protein
LVSLCQSFRGWFRSAKISHDKRTLLQKDKRKLAPVSALGQGIALTPLSSSPSSRGGWRTGKALAWIARPKVWFGFRAWA